LIYQDCIAQIKVATSLDENVLQLPVKDQPVVYDYGNGILASFLIDNMENYSYLQNSDIVEIGVDKIFEFGVYNLANKLNTELELQQTEDVYVVSLDGVFEASLILIDQFWDVNLSHLVENTFIACIPSRDVLVFCDVDSVDGIKKLREIVEKVWPDGDHLLSKNLYKRINSKWVIFGD